MRCSVPPVSLSRRAGLALGLAAALGCVPQLASAQAFPSKPVRIITPFPVGGGPDGVARLVADKLSKSWGQPVVVENRPGGNGFIAIDAFKRGAKDGHDLIVLDNVHLAAYPSLFKKLPYDTAKDFDPLLPLFRTYFFFTVGTNSPYKTVADVVADAKARPGKLNYGSWSVGNPVHLGSELFESMTGTQMEHVIFKETTQLYTSVATGELAFALGSAATAGGDRLRADCGGVEASRLRALAGGERVFIAGNRALADGRVVDAAGSRALPGGGGIGAAGCRALADGRRIGATGTGGTAVRRAVGTAGDRAVAGLCARHSGAETRYHLHLRSEGFAMFVR